MDDSIATNKKSFLKVLLHLMLPIVVQNLISALVSTADVLMLSGVGQSALSASSLAGQVTFVLTLFYLGLSTGASVLTAQYWGKRDLHTIGQIQVLALRCSSIISLVFFLAALCIPQLLMRIFTTDPVLVELGAIYLRSVSTSYLAMGISQMLLAVIKSIEKTRLCAIISTVGLFVNIAFNALAVLVLFPDNPKGALAGVAWATVLARVIELVLCLIVLHRGQGVISSLQDCLKTPLWLCRDFIRCTLPAARTK